MEPRDSFDGCDLGFDLDFEGRPNEQESISSIFERMLSDESKKRMSDNRRASLAWFSANGSLERKHTTGVFLKKARGGGCAPVLGVYVDSRARMTDFNANREIYLARLASVGLEVSSLEFRLSKTQPQVSAGAENRQSKIEGDRQSLPPLPDSERKRIEEIVSTLPEGLREKASRAMEVSLRRHMLSDT